MKANKNTFPSQTAPNFYAKDLRRADATITAPANPPRRYKYVIVSKYTGRLNMRNERKGAMSRQVVLVLEGSVIPVSSAAVLQDAEAPGKTHEHLPN